MARRQGEREIPKGREGCGHPHDAYNINGRWLGGDDRVTLAVERSMSHCVQCMCMCVYAHKIYIHIYSDVVAMCHPPTVRYLRM